MNFTTKTLIFWLVVLISATALWQVVKTANSSQAVPEISYSQFLSQINVGNVASVNISKTRANGTYRQGGSFRVFLPESQEQVLGALQAKDVDVWYTESQDASTWSWATNLAPLVLLAALWYFMIRQMRIATKASAARANAGASAAPPIA